MHNTRSRLTITLTLLAVTTIWSPPLFAGLETDSTSPGTAPATTISPSDQLVVLWTSGDREVALKTVFIYVYNAKKYEWWRDITFIIWGPSSKLLAEDEELQTKLADMKEVGVHLTACKWCSDEYGVSEKLTALGVEVKYMGKDLTEFIQSGQHVLTF